MKNYTRLSEVYDLAWGDFAARFAGFAARRLEERGFRAARILDLACGTGILATALADAGHTVRGIDISPEMIAAARARSRGRAGVAFDVQDMRRFEAGSGYDMITCSFDALNYIVDPADLESVFLGVAAALSGEGIFVFDSNTTRQYSAVLRGGRDLGLGGKRLSQRWAYDPRKREARTTFVFEDGAREIHKQRPYDLPEIESLLGRAKMRLAGAWSSPDGDPFRPDSIRLYALAEKGPCRPRNRIS